MILAVDHQNVAYAVSLSGGGTRTLARPHALTSAPIRLLGVNGAAALWGPEFEPTDALSATSELSISDIGSRKDAVARPFWSDKPPGMRPVALRAYPDGGDAWLITGVETLADGTMHVSVWHVDGAGNGARVGCGPALPDESFGIIDAVFPTPETVYAVLASSSAPSAFIGYALVRIDRPAAAR
jgi:hypothetical protein